MNRMQLLIKLGFVLGLLLFISACGKKDEELILGKWQNEQDWFEYRKDKKYSAGKAMITMVNNFGYSLDPKTHELTMYTDEENQTYYLVYRFMGEDTLAVYNRLSTDTSLIKFHRVK